MISPRTSTLLGADRLGLLPSKIRRSCSKIAGAAWAAPHSAAQRHQRTSQTGGAPN